MPYTLYWRSGKFLWVFLLCAVRILSERASKQIWTLKYFLLQLYKREHFVLHIRHTTHSYYTYYRTYNKGKGIYKDPLLQSSYRGTTVLVKTFEFVLLDWILPCTHHSWSDSLILTAHSNCISERCLLFCMKQFSHAKKQLASFVRRVTTSTLAFMIWAPVLAQSNTQSC